MSKINIYYLCMFALLLVCVSGLDDLEKVKKNKMMNAMKSVSSSKIIDSNNDGEDLLGKKRNNFEEERELEENGTDTPDDSPASTAEGTTTPEVTTTVSSDEGENGSEEASESTASTPAATTTAADTGSTEATTTGETSSTSETTTGPSETGSTVEGTTGETSATTETKETSSDTGSTTAAPETTTTPDESDIYTGTDEETTAPSGTTPAAETGTGSTAAPEELKCSYQYSTYKFIKGSETKKTLYPVAYDYNGAPITYTKKNCNNEKIELLSDGNITLTPNDISEDKITCTIECKVGNQSKETNITINFVDYKPIGFNLALSKIPVVVNVSTPFNLTVVLQYPTISGITKEELGKSVKDVELNIKNFKHDEYNITEDDVNNLANSASSKSIEIYWEDLQINYNGTESRNSGRYPVKFNITDNDYGLNEEFTIKVNHDENCNEDFGFDPEGLCCSGRRYKNEYCTKVKGTFKFESSKSESDFNVFKDSFLDLVTTLLRGSPFWKKEDGSKGTEIGVTMTYIKGSNNSDTDSRKRLLENGDNTPFNWDTLFNNGEIDPIQFGSALLSIVGPSDDNTDKGKLEVPPELQDTQIGDMLTKLVEKDEVKQAVKEVTTKAEVLNIKKADDYFTAETTDEPFFSGESKKPWAEEYWWAILLICIGAVLIIGIVVAVLVISLSSSGSSKTNKKDLEKSEKIMETVIPIDKIKQENEISDDDIYKPFSYEVIMEGYLLKEGRDRVVGKWQRRYCVLYFEPSVLRIYDSMVPSYYGKVYIDEKQSIPLECYNGIEYKEGSNEFTLILKVRDSTIKAFEVGDKERKIQMKVEGENGVETAKRWVECFRDFKSQKPKSGDAWTRPLIIDQNNGKISTTTNKAVEKKNEEIVLKAQQRRQAAASTK